MRADRLAGQTTSVLSDANRWRAKLRVLVDSLEDLNSPDANVNQPGSEHLAAALHEEDSRGVVLWAILRPFLKLYLKMFHGSAAILSDAEIAKSIDVMLDEPMFFLTQQLIKRYLRGEGPVNLAELAEYRYPRRPPNGKGRPPKSKGRSRKGKNRSSKWESFQRTLSRKKFKHARALQLWRIDEIGREDKNGGGTIARYEISAGQALIDFDEFVFRPRREMQYRRFCKRYLQPSTRGKTQLVLSLGALIVLSALVLLGFLDYSWADIGQVRI